MPAPYGTDLRTRAILMVTRDGLSRAKTARTLRISENTLRDWLTRFVATGSVDPMPWNGGRRSAISKDDDYKFAKMVDEGVKSTLFDLTRRWSEISGKKVSSSCMQRALRARKYSHKRISIRPLARATSKNKEAKEKFLKAISRVDLERLVFLDECGCSPNLSKRSGWSKQGERREVLEKWHSNQNYTVLGAIRASGPIAMSSMFGGMKKKDFENFFQYKILPRLSMKDVVVLDNLRSHHSEAIKKAAKLAGVRLLYLPPYSPEFNAIEMLWAVLKHHLRLRPNKDAAFFRSALTCAWRRATKGSLAGFVTKTKVEIRSAVA